MEPIKELRSATGLEMLQVFQPRWEEFKKAYSISYQGKDTEAEENDRAWFYWQSFRGEHQANSCLLDDAGQVIGLIIKETTLQELRLPPLPSLQYLYICDNENLKSFQFGGDYPELVHVDLSNNVLTKLDIKGFFPELKYLNVSRNQINRFTFRTEAPVLEELDASHNQIKNWDAFILDKLPSLEYLFLDNNPLNESVITYRTEEEDQNYLTSQKKLRAAYEKGEKVLNDEFKVLVIGDGKAGKSCMVHRLVDDDFLEDWNSTHGISVRQFDPKEDEKNRFPGFQYKLNLWDFGGQDIYHHTHRMFLQANSTYVLLWNEATEYSDFITQETKRRTYEWRNKKLVYWLDYVRFLGKNSPVIVAQTCCSPLDNEKGHPAEINIKARYKKDIFLPDFLQIDAKPDDLEDNGYEGLMDNLKAAIKSLNRDEYLPEHWVTIRKMLDDKKTPDTVESERDFLGKDKNHTLDFEEYCTLAREAGEDNPEQLLNNWLVQTGVVFYKKGLFDNKIILNQSWAIRAVYALYDRSPDGFYSDIEKNQGKFNGDLLNRCWNEYSPEERQWFLQFMLDAELCFETTRDKESRWEDREFLALEMLPEKQCAVISYVREDWKKPEVKRDLCELSYVYPFLHIGVIQSFIVRTYRYAEKVEDIYKNGLLIKVDGAPVIVEAIPKEKSDGYDYDAQSGTIQVSTLKEHIAVLRRIQKEFEEIHAEREVEQHVRVGENPWVNWKILQSAQNDSFLPTVDEKVTPTEPYQIFLLEDKKPVNSLSGSADSPDFIMNMPKRENVAGNEHKAIYFSYAWGDDQEAGESRETLVDDLYNALSKEQYVLKRDKKDIGYKGLIQDFMKDLGRSKLVIVAISDKYLRSEYCMFELYEIFRNCKQEKEKFVERIFPFMTEPIALDDPEVLGDYLSYWEKKRESWDKLAGRSNVGPEYHKKIHAVRDINHSFSDIVAFIQDMNKLNRKLITENDFGIIKASIQEAMKKMGE